MEFDEMMDEVWTRYAGIYTVGPENLDRVAGLMAEEALNDYKTDFLNVVKIEMLKRFNAFYDVMQERANGKLPD